MENKISDVTYRANCYVIFILYGIYN